jgi:hypothetical protein
MKRSRAVQAFLVISAATALANCGQKHDASRRCVDENGSFTDDRNCSSPAAGSPHRYSWVYAPAGASNKTEEGASAAPGANKGAEAEGTSRGVIGAEGAAHAAAGEGGHAAGGGAGAGE